MFRQTEFFKEIAIMLAALMVFPLGTPVFAFDSQTLPTGGQVTAGQAAISQTASNMTIQQATQKAAINWQDFSIGSNAGVRFNQPNTASIALNRVIGQNPSQIMGSLSANGQVFIINPSGVLFGRGAQVNAAAILASTRNISDADFMAGRYRFAGDGTGTVVNEGNLIAADNGYVTLIGAHVTNSGTIIAPKGDVRLSAANKVTITLDNNSLTGFTVDQGTFDALAENKGLIKADAGRIYLTADGLNQLSKAVVNNEGILEAKTIENRNGAIVLLADKQIGKTTVSGTLDASAPNGGDGGFIETSGADVQVIDNVTITTNAPYGKTGTWLIDPQDYIIAASGGDMTGSQLSSNLGSSNVTILSSAGGTSGNGDIFVNDAVSWNTNTLELTAARDIDINDIMTASGSAKLVMNPATANGGDPAVSGGAVKCGFNPDGTFRGRVDFPGRSGTGFLYINGVDYALLNSLGAAGSTTAADLQGMNGNLAGHYALGNDIDASATSVWNGGAGFEPVGNATSPFTGAFDGLGHKITGLHINRPVTDNVGFFGYAVGADIRNTGIVGGSIIGQGTVGGLAGGASSVNHTDPSGTIIYDKKNFIYNSYATCNVSGTWNGGWSGGGAGGLIGANMYGSEIHNSHATGNISGNGHVGGLAGTNRLNATITNSYATGNVTSSPIGYWSGGLVGSHEYGSILENSFATGNVSHTGAGAAGGLTGDNLFIWNGATNIIRNCYATGNVNANVPAGGLVGQNDSGAIIENSYAIGQVTSTHPWVGGLVGANSWWSPGTATIQNSFWDQTTSGQANAAGFNNGTITNCSAKTTAEMKTLSIFTGAGWDIDGQGGTGKVWRIYDGKTYPLLRNFLTPFTIKANDDSKTYDGRRYYGESGITYLEYNKPVSYLSSNLHGAPPSYGGDSQGAKNVGSYAITASGYYSIQQGYDITYANGALTITPKPYWDASKDGDWSGASYDNPSAGYGTIRYEGKETPPAIALNAIDHPTALVRVVNGGIRGMRMMQPQQVFGYSEQEEDIDTNPCTCNIVYDESRKTEIGKCVCNDGSR